MEILPHAQKRPGILTEIPFRLYPFIIDWADVKYTEYDFGGILEQSFSTHLYRIHFLRFLINHDIQLSLSVPDPTITLQFMIQGQGYSYLSLASGFYSLIYLPRGGYVFNLEPGEYEIFSIDLDTSMIEVLADSRTEIKEFTEMKKNANENLKVLEAIQINYMVRDIVEDIRKCHETGADLLMELRTATLNLLNIYRKGLNNKEYTKGLPIEPYREVMIKIRDEIATDPNKLSHTLSYFTQKFNLSDSTLKRCFKAFFRKSFGLYVLEECMKKAAWLTKDSSLNLDDIALQVGYLEKSGFIRAYKRFHGKTPKRGD